MSEKPIIVRVYRTVRDSLTGWILPHGQEHDPATTTVETNYGWPQALERLAQYYESKAAHAESKEAAAAWFEAAEKARELAKSRPK